MSKLGVAEVERTVLEVDSVLEFGPGIRPNTRYAKRWYLAVEPHHEYVEVLLAQGLMVLQATALQALQFIQKVDTILLIDVLEHMERREGEEVLRLCLEKARKQVAVFTPLGFQVQQYSPGEKDAWGMDGQHWQTHRSGWTPEDFHGWNLGVNEHFHGSGKGAIYAVHNR